MLISFAVTNYLSFRGRMELNMLTLESDDSLKDNVKDVPIKRSRGAKVVPLLKSAAIYGRNASGKSNLLNALIQTFSFMKDNNDVNLKNLAIPFVLDPNNRSEPTEFEIKLLLNGIIYRYGFTVLGDKVHDEWLFSAEKARERLVFEREWHDNLGACEYEFGPLGTKQFRDLVPKVRPDSLLLTVGAEFNATDAMTISSFLGLLLRHEDMWSATKDRITDKELKVLTELLHYADIGLKEIRSTPFILSSSRLSGLGATLENLFISFKPRRNMNGLEFMYADSNHELVNIPPEYQSSGTKCLFSLFLTILRSYRSGAIFICDELEQSLHPMMCEALLRFFHCLPNNKSQLIFTTHNAGLLNADVLRRDQVWIMEKYPNGQSCALRLSDYKGVRKGAKLGKHYLEGMFGGLPVLDEHIMRNILKALDEDGDQGA